MKVSSSQYAKTLLALSDTGDVRRIAASFLALVRRNRAAKRLPAILRMAERLSDERDGVISLSVETATEADASVRQAIESVVAGFFPGKRPVFRYGVVFGLVGGARISSDDEMIDATVRRRLIELEKALR
ncbi:MAG: F0F1 ATP synthase subunit delta [Candidatus Moranbacteria bacterium]|nr:F0F1 ATP synthase subunit delta [Candidatus Moranbacteria bacterium]